MLRFFILLSFLCSFPALSDAGGAAVADLYSADQALSAKAVRELSAAAPGAEAAAVVSAIRKELACVGAAPRPAACHAPVFLANALAVAGALALKDTGAPWDFLVWLAEGGTVNEGSFFQDPEEADGHRDAYFSPARQDPKLTRSALQARLDAAIAKAGIVPSCDWPADRVKKMAKPKLAAGELALYGYSRDYSPAGIQGQYRVVHSSDWLFKGGRLAACAGRLEVLDLKDAGSFVAEILDRSGEQPALDITVYDLKSGGKACAYSIEGLSDLSPDPLMEAAAAPARYLPKVLQFYPGGCKPRKVKGYSYTRL